jgi:PAS domain S-box-containing protein|nr:PAS domain S-box protein [uncultured Psychroserpens sp.]
MSQSELDILKRALEREKAARKAAEKILEERSKDLYASSLKVKQLLDEKSAQLQGVFENIVDAYVVMDVNGNVLKFNEAATKLFGYDIDKESVNVLNLIYKGDYQYAMASYMDLQTNGFFKDYVARVYTKSGEVKWVHINASVIFDRDKTPIAAQGIVRDITEDKKRRELVIEQKTQLDAIVDNASFGIVLTHEGEILKTNLSFQNLIGYSEEEFLKLSIKDISFSEDFPLSKDYITKMDAGEINNFVINKRYKKKDGSILWAKTNVNAVNDNQGKIKHQVALIEDITEQREKDLMISLINDVAKSILGKLEINSIASVITGKIAQFLGTDDCVIYIVNSKEKTVEQIAAFGSKINTENQVINNLIFPINEGITGRVAQTGVAEIIKDTSKDSAYIIDEKVRLSELVVPIINNGEVIGIIDSEHPQKNHFTKEHLKAIQNVANIVAVQLKSAINTREKERVESQNKQLFNQLEKSNDELQEYAHIVSHDLKSPLRSIDALVNWLKEDNKDKLDDVSLQNFAHIESTLEKMEQLITDILEYSSVGSDNSETTDVDTNSIVNDLMTMLFIPEHIEIKLLQKLPVIKGDKTKLEQVFQNLLSNAIKFCDKDKGLIEIDVVAKPEYYEFSIRDNGIGIDKKFHDKIFKIFHALNKSKDSTGIGLSIVKKIVNLHDGEIWLESEPQKGSTFYFTLKR